MLDHVPYGPLPLRRKRSDITRKSFHVDCGALEMPYAKTDAYAALEASRRALTIAGVDGTRLACARTEDDLPHNVNPTNIATVSEVVTEVIRRS